MSVVVVGLLALLAGLLLWKYQEDGRRQREKRARRARLRRIERRRRLQERLERKTGDPLAARKLVLQEARRLGIRPSSIEALDAALRNLAGAAGKPRIRPSLSGF